MGYSCRVVCDSESADTLIRLTTLEITLPRIVLAELNTHRVFSRSSASSRAIPAEKRIAMVDADPFIPESFGKNRPGMQASEDLDGEEAKQARTIWLDGLRDALDHARELSKLGVHKQLANRLLEPYAWTTVLITATEWDNFFALRCSPEAQPEIRRAAEMMRDAMGFSVPRVLSAGEWHLPYIDEHDRRELKADALIDLDCVHQPGMPCCPLERLAPRDAIDISVGRCARVSTLTHEGRRDYMADLSLTKRLRDSGHMSPFEHPAMATKSDAFCGNFAGWKQARKFIANEADFSLHHQLSIESIAREEVPA